MTPAEQPPSRSPWAIASQVSYLGIFFGVAVLIGYGAGRWCERRWGGAPWISLAGVLIGVVSGFRELYRVGKRYSAGR
jgi:hypothetical protein